MRALDVTDHDAVFRVFEEFRDELGGLDRVIVNAGLGKGQPLGTGRFDANRQTAETNFIGALAQTEAAAADLPRPERRPPGDDLQRVGPARDAEEHHDVRRHQGRGRAPRRGLPRRHDGTPIKVTVLYPGYIVSEMSGTSAKTPLVASTEKGVRAMVEAIEKEKESARVPAGPGSAGFVIKHVRVGVLRKMS